METPSLSLSNLHYCKDVNLTFTLLIISKVLPGCCPPSHDAAKCIKEDHSNFCLCRGKTPWTRTRRRWFWLMLFLMMGSLMFIFHYSTTDLLGPLRRSSASCNNITAFSNVSIHTGLCFHFIVKGSFEKDQGKRIFT